MISYVRFCEAQGIKLEAGQRVVALVAFDGVDPVDLPPAQRELARKIFGGVDRFTAQQRRIFAAVCGGRAGKTRLFTAMRLLHLGLTFDASVLAPGEAGYGMIVAPKKTHGWQALAYIRGIVMASPVLRGHVLVDNRDELSIDRNGHTVTWLVTGASAKGDTQRGKTLFGASLEEAAFFRDEKTGVVNDVEIFEAIEPRVITGGQVIVPSTPWAEEGLLWDLFDRNHGHPVDGMAAHAATLLLRSDPEISARVEAMLAHPTKAANARREFGAEFMAMGAFSFFDKALVESALTDIAYEPAAGDQMVAGSDLGFVNNSSALAIAAVRGQSVVLASLVERLPANGPLRPSETVQAFAAEAKRHGVTSVMSDGHYRETMREHLGDAGLYVLSAPEGSSGKRDGFERLRELLLEGRLVLPRGPLTERLVAQLVEVKARPTAGGGVSFSLPTWLDGSHGDLVAALVLAAWQRHGVEVKGAPAVLSASEREDARGKAIEQSAIERHREASNPRRSTARAWGR